MTGFLSQKGPFYPKKDLNMTISLYDTFANPQGPRVSYYPGGPVANIRKTGSQQQHQQNENED